jgi:hypothetical protein
MIEQKRGQFMKYRVLAGVFLVSTILAARPAAAQTAGAAGVTTVHVRGTVGAVFGALPNGGEIPSQFSLITQRGTGQTPGSVLTFLTFDVQIPEADGLTDVAGFGFIPNAAMSGDGTSRVALDVDLSQVAGFSAQSCFAPANGDPVTCQPAPLGWVHADWRASANNKIHITGTEQSTFFQFKTSGVEDETLSGSLVSGTLLGMTFTNASGSIGTASSTTVSIQRIR